MVYVHECAQMNKGVFCCSPFYFLRQDLSEPEVGCFSEAGQNGPRSAHLSLPMPGLQARTVLHGFYVSARDLNAALLLSVSS